MTIEPTLTRRTVLGVSTAACGLALAGCSATSQGAEPAGSTPAPIPTSSSSTPVQVGRLADVPVGGSAAGKANGKGVLIFRPDETTVLAYSDVCTHAGCTVAAAGTKFTCPCHGSTFKAEDGTVVVGPARQALERYAAAIDGEFITVSI
ncbi:Rieske (2Fe-2S) protein [Arthrobacter sp. 35W]|uniref:Rieske (2Fe-2S) protein n=1 Tax=Arthrobacter sp. 35W TaxID=1132441 RepID=UPI000416E301|nr:Rieske (2Fe-2S) protein [Arthrobacter sp. 35W]